MERRNASPEIFRVQGDKVLTERKESSRVNLLKQRKPWLLMRGYLLVWYRYGKMCLCCLYNTLCILDGLCQAYLTFVPKTNKIVWDFRDVVAVVVANGAGADFWLGIKHLLTKLLQLRVVTVKEQMPSQLFRTLHRTESTVSPKTVSLPLAQRVEFALVVYFLFIIAYLKVTKMTTWLKWKCSAIILEC